jgi:hypothetical protein
MSPSDAGRIAVESSLISSVNYSPQATLEVEFRSGAVYRYFLVSKGVFEGLMAAPSKGVYFNRHIRTAFRSERIA